MNNFKETLLLIDRSGFESNELVSILELVVSKLHIDTISGMARSEGKTPRGIKISDRYKKTTIGCQTMVVAGVRDDGFPF